MKAYFNGTYQEEEKILVSTGDRSFSYGDGFFETMLGFSGSVKLLGYHLERIKSALKQLWMEVPEELEAVDRCAGIIRRLYEENNPGEFTKIKLQVWRKEGGKYLPHQNECNVLVKMKATDKPQPGYKHKVSFSENVKNRWNQISKYKSVSALQYVMAGIEMKLKQLDEIIITDTNDVISECLVSNIFWLKENKVYTPSLATGCIEGVSRRFLLEELKNHNIPSEEIEASKNTLLQADSIFCTNATGISHIVKLESKMFPIFTDIENICKFY